MTHNKKDTHSELIQASWARCKSYELIQTQTPAIVKLNQAQIRHTINKQKQLINITGNEVLPFYDSILSNTQCLISLIDECGYLLKSWGHRHFLHNENKDFFVQGVNWKEEINGTNATGIALHTGQSVQVQRDEHYFYHLRNMTGTASAIYNTDESIAGVLNITSDCYLPHAHTLGLVKLISQSIENKLILNKFGHSYYTLTFNTNKDIVDSQWAGIIIFDHEGYVVSSNRRAKHLLGNSPLLLKIDNIFDCSTEKIKQYKLNNPLPLITSKKYRMYASLAPPTRKLTCISCSPNNNASDHASVSEKIIFDNFSYGDSSIEQITLQASRIIEKDIPILVQGETGVGKDEFVRSLHQYSSRNNKPLISINCAAIPSELIESELFGYEKGAFTGASNTGFIGLIRQSHKGILFLDEIGDMPVKVQSRLLRVLQDRKVTPLGSAKSFNVDIKIVCATNVNLKEKTNSGDFRKDLFYRLSGLNITIPPLRDREDKLELFRKIHAMHRDYNQYQSLKSSIIELFNSHPWPGNIRQLVSVMKVALAMAGNAPIELQHIPDDFFDDIAVITKQKKNTTHDLLHNNPTLDNLREKNLLDTYKQFDGNISKTARVLGISRNTLYKRLKLLNQR